MSEMSYTLETIERRAFYTYILANLNGMCVISPKSHELTALRSLAYSQILPTKTCEYMSH